MTRITRTPVSHQQALVQISLAYTRADTAGQALAEFLAASAISDPVVVSLALRAKSLLLEAAQHLDAAAQRLEEA